jgi:hypothetical protein
VPLESAVNLDSIESVAVALLVERLGRLSDARMREVCEAPAVATGFSPYVLRERRARVRAQQTQQTPFYCVCCVC